MNIPIEELVRKAKWLAALPMTPSEQVLIGAFDRDVVVDMLKQSAEALRLAMPTLVKDAS